MRFPNLLLPKGFLILAMTALLACGCNRSSKQEKLTARKLLNAVLPLCREEDGTKRPMEAISAMAAVVGERCIDAAGEYKTRGHSFIPGQRVFSDKVNELLCGDNGSDKLTAIPAKSVFGTLRDELAGTAYRRQFPELVEVFGGFADRIGKPDDWGKVPLSLPEDQRPKRLPLRIAFDSRTAVDDVLKPMLSDKEKCLRVATLALAALLSDVANEVDRPAALKLAFETINSMAKTAPMTTEVIDTPTEAMKEAQGKVIKIERRKSDAAKASQP